MLVGKYQGKLGEKRRVSVPLKLRQELGESLVIARWYENCLVVVSGKRWAELLNRVRGEVGLVTRPVRDVERFIMGSAFELAFDALGRILIPEELAKYANLSQDIVFLGLGDRVEIWDSGVWREKEAKVAANATQTLEDLAKNG